MTYRAPVNDMLFCMKELANLEAVAKLPGFEDAGIETAQAVLEECARFNEEVVAPLNWEGDKFPSSWKEGVVTTTPGFKQAFRQFGEGGWQGLQHPSEFGGQNLPKTIGAACIEMLNSANLSFALCPLLTDGAIEALLTAGSPEQQALYLPKMISGEWTGTMNLTEPQAGSDLAAVRTRAEPQPDGSYKIFGTKIYITYGEHDMAPNIVHLVLARVSGAPEGVKGISLFIVPKFMVNADGSLGERNDVHCVSIEHKLGIKASPTAVLQFGDGTALKDGNGTGPGAVGSPSERVEVPLVLRDGGLPGFVREVRLPVIRRVDLAEQLRREEPHGRFNGRDGGVFHRRCVPRVVWRLAGRAEARSARHSHEECGGGTLHSRPIRFDSPLHG